MRLLGMLALVLALVVTGVPSQAAAPDTSKDPRAIVRSALDEVLAVLGNSQLNETQRFGRVKEIAYAQFDFDTMSKLVLARNWKRFDAQQREEFTREFRELLASTYGERLDRYGDVEVAITGEQKHKRGDVSILTAVTEGQFEGVEINYRLRPEQGTWKVIDVVIEGISLVSSYRTQFRDALSGSSPAKLLERMREKNIVPAGGESVATSPAST